MMRLILLAATCLLLAQGTALAADKVRLRLDWYYGSEHAPIFLARDKGFFAEEGIDVELMSGEGSTVTVKLVGNRTTEFGYAGADQALLAFGRELPVVSTAVILQKSPSAIIYRTSTGIKTLKDLYGKTLGVMFRSNTEKQWRAVAKIQGIDGSKIREVPANQTMAQLIEANAIDAGIAFFFNDGMKLVSDGIPTGWILFADAGLPIYSTALITNAELIKEKPELVHRFTRAFVKGWTYALSNPEETLATFLKDNPAVDAQYNALKFPEVLKLTQSADSQSHGIGYTNKENWEAMQSALIEMELMKKPVDVTQVFTNDFLK
jgi:NitT/TauT family transport system substrate-binding protein